MRVHKGNLVMSLSTRIEHFPLGLVVFSDCADHRAGDLLKTDGRIGRWILLVKPLSIAVGFE